MKRTQPTQIKTASFTASIEDSGTLFIINVADCVVTLPALSTLGADSVYFDFVVKALSATTGLSLSPNSADAIDGGTDDKDFINTAATDALSDGIRISGSDDDATSWWTRGRQGTWAAEA